MLKTLNQDATFRSLDAARQAAAQKINRFSSPAVVGEWERANERCCNYMRQFQAARRELLAR